MIYFNYRYTFLCRPWIEQFLKVRAKTLLMFVTSVYASKVPGLDHMLNRKLLTKGEWGSLFCHFPRSAYVRVPLFSVKLKLRCTRSDHTICWWGKAEGIWGNWYLGSSEESEQEKQCVSAQGCQAPGMNQFVQLGGSGRQPTDFTQEAAAIEQHKPGKEKGALWNQSWMWCCRQDETVSLSNTDVPGRQDVPKHLFVIIQITYT